MAEESGKRRKVGGGVWSSMITRSKAAKMRVDLFDLLLPNEVLVKIFSHLDLVDLFYGIAGVSRRFRTLCTLAAGIAEVDAGTAVALGGEVALRRFLRLMPQLRKLEIDLEYHVSTSTIVAALENCPRLESIGAWCGGGGDGDVAALGPALRDHGANLRVLTLGCDRQSKAAAALDPDCLRNLTSIDLVGCWKITNALLLAIAENCGALEKFGIEEERQDDVVDILLAEESYDELNVERFLRALKGSLRELSWWTNDSSNAGGGCFKVLGECLRLEKLDLHIWQKGFGTSSSSDVLASILQLPRLAHLCVGSFAAADNNNNNNNNNSHSVAAAFAGKTLPSLKSLVLLDRGILDDDDLLSAIADSCGGGGTGLTRLFLIDVGSIWHDGMTQHDLLRHFAVGGAGHGRLSAIREFFDRMGPSLKKLFLNSVPRGWGEEDHWRFSNRSVLLRRRP